MGPVDDAIAVAGATPVALALSPAPVADGGTDALGA
jgi:hypothetical protein